jgi:hypothetical protein
MQYEAWSKDKLISRIFDLEAAVDALKEASGVDKTAQLCAALGLTPIEGRFVAALVSGKVMTARSVYNTMYFDRIDEVDIGTLRVIASRVRLKLFPFGISIETIHGTGYKMDGADIVRQAMDGVATTDIVDAVPVARRKWRRVLDAIKSRADKRGVAQFKTADIAGECDLAGGLGAIIRGFEKQDILRIIQRPTKRDLRRHWRVAMREVSGE